MSRSTILAALLACVGCAGAQHSLAHDDLASTQQTIRLAEMKGVGRDANSAAQLQLAREQVALAGQLANDEPERARGLLARARADLQLAVAIQEEALARAEDGKLSSRLIELQGTGGSR